VSDCLSAKAVGRRAATIDCHTLMDDDGNEVVKGILVTRDVKRKDGWLSRRAGKSLREAKSFDFGL